jgi:hypothetical protein
MNGSENSKLLELRSKTDHQLIELIDHQVETGMRLLGQANGSLHEAKRAWTDAGALLPLVHAFAPQRRALEFKWHILGRMLQNSATTPWRVRAACSIVPA